jgi:predicted nucleic acid-binding protein
MATTLYFLDTNILVHLVREDGIGQYLKGAYSLYTVEPRPIISGVTEGELRSLAIQWKRGAQKQDKMRYLLSFFWRMQIEKPEVYEAYAAIDSHNKRNGMRMSENDTWIAASTHVMRACLLTTDTDFDHLQAIFITREWIDPERDKKS